MSSVFDLQKPGQQNIIVQHNHFINARFELSLTEMRLFISMLKQLKRNDTEFHTYEIPVQDFLNVNGGKTYEYVREACRNMAHKSIEIEVPPDEKKKSKRVFATYPLMAECVYVEGSGRVRCLFNERIKPYLLQLTKNFTIAQVEELLKLKSFYSYRIYWLLKQYEDFGERTIDLQELRRMLMIGDDKYTKFDNFKRRVLNAAQEELENTDIPFDYEIQKKGRVVKGIRFVLRPKEPMQEESTSSDADWKRAYQYVGFEKDKIVTLEVMLQNGLFEEDYLWYIGRRYNLNNNQSQENRENAYLAIVQKSYYEEFLRTQKKPPKSADSPASNQPAPETDQSASPKGRKVPADERLRKLELSEHQIGKIMQAVGEKEIHKTAHQISWDLVNQPQLNPGEYAYSVFKKRFGL